MVPLCVARMMKLLFDIVFILQVLDIDECPDLIILLNIDKVLDCPALGSFSSFRDFIHPEPETFSFFCKEQQVIMVCGDKQVFEEVLIPDLSSFYSSPSPVLTTVFR